MNLKTPAMAGIVALTSIFAQDYNPANTCEPERDRDNKLTGNTLCWASVEQPDDCKKIRTYWKEGEPVTSYSCKAKPFLGM